MNEWFCRKIIKSSFNGIYEALIHEGYFATYDIDKLKNTLIRKLGNRFQFSGEDILKSIGGAETKYGIIYTLSCLLDDASNEDINDIKKIVQMFGYYISIDEKRENGSYEFMIEPINALDITSILEHNKIKQLYHITHKSNISKIKKIGLAPRGTETTFYHPDDRIYLLYSDTEVVINAFKKVLAKNKKMDEDEFIILTIPFNDKYRYFLDDTGTSLEIPCIACFVLQNIPPPEIIFPKY